MATQEQAGILLESGTNEVEILEFYVHGQSFGINVAKIQEIVKFRQDLVTQLPEQPPSICGSYLIRNKIYLLVDMSKQLFNIKTDIENKHKNHVVLITEFNKNSTGFLLESVNRIYRCNWNQLTPLSEYAHTNNLSALGTINIEGRDIIILDLESILSHIVPTFDRLDKMNAKEESQQSAVTKREHAKIIVAEDSSYIRGRLVTNLKALGYTNIHEFPDGQAAYEYIAERCSEADSQKQNVDSQLNCIITDIEMPRMDGLTLCNRIRQELHLNDLPIIMFSSLVNDQMMHKCKSVGGNACVNKADAKQLLKSLDYHCLGQYEA